MLEPILRDRGEHGRIVALLELGDHDDSPPELRGELLRRAAEISAGPLADPGAALRRYCASLEQDPLQDDVIARVEALAVELDGIDVARPILAALIDGGLPLETELAVRRALGRFAAARDDAPEQEAQLRAILELKPDDLDVTDRLIAVYRELGRDDELIDLCTAKLELPLMADERAAALRTLAQTTRRVGQVAAAEVHCRALLEIEPDDDATLEALEEIYRGREDHRALVEVLERRAELEKDDGRFAERKAEAASLRAERLDDKEGAITDLEDALDRQPAARDLARRLEGLYREVGLTHNLFDFLERQLGDQPEDARRVEILTELGRLCRQDLGRVEAAIVYYEQARALEPGDRAVEAALVSLYRKAGRHEDLFEIHRARLDRAEGDAERVEALASMVQLRLDKGERGEGLAADIEKILAIDPEHGLALGLLAEVRGQQGRTVESLDLYARAIERVGDAEEAIELHRKAGRVAAASDDHAAQARAHYEAVVAVAPDDDEASAALERVVASSGDKTALAGLLAGRFEAEDDPERRLQLACRVAEIHAEDLDDADGFLTWIGKARAIRDDDPKVVSLLIAFHEGRGDLDELVPLLSWYVSWLEARRDFRAAGEQAHRLAGFLVRTEAWSEAAVYARMATRYDPENFQPMLTYAEVLEHQGEWDLARNVYQGILMLEGQIKERDLRADIFFRMARVCHHLKDSQRTHQYLERCLMIDPDHAGASALAEALG